MSPGRSNGGFALFQSILQIPPDCGPLRDQFDSEMDFLNPWAAAASSPDNFLKFGGGGSSGSPPVYLEVRTANFDTNETYPAGTTVQLGCFFRCK